LRYNSEDRFELEDLFHSIVTGKVRERLTRKVTFNIALADVSDELISRIEELFTSIAGIIR
jgi:hypothetical protein